MMKSFEELDIPKSILPEPMPSSCIYGYTDPTFLGDEIPIAGAAGDQQVALLGRHVSVKVRQKYIRNRSLLLMNTGEKPVYSKTDLLPR